MHQWKEGDRSVGICGRCEKRTETRFERRQVPLDWAVFGGLTAMVSVCMECDEITDIPHQSIPGGTA